MPAKPPETLQVSETGPELVLCGTGDRVIKIGFIQVGIYNAAFYLDPEAATESLGGAFSGHSLDDLLGDGEFFPALVSGKFAKVVRLAFCRALPKGKLAPGFDSTLMPRIAPETAEDGKAFVQGMIPDAGYQENDVLLLIFHAGGSLIEAQYIAKGVEDPVSLMQLKSPGPEGVCAGMQNIYFDAKTEMPAVKHGFVGKLPALLSSEMSKRQAAVEKVEAEASGGAPAGTGERPALQRMDTQAITEAAAEQVAGSFSEHKEKKEQKTWRGASGRNLGGDGYRFGDYSRTILAKTMRKGSAFRGRTSTKQSTIHEDSSASITASTADHEEWESLGCTAESPPVTAESPPALYTFEPSRSASDDTADELNKFKARCTALERRAKEAEALAQELTASRTSLLVLGVVLGLALSLSVGYLLPGAQMAVTVLLLIGSVAYTASTGYGGMLKGAVAARSPALSEYYAPLLDNASLSGQLDVEASPLHSATRV